MAFNQKTYERIMNETAENIQGYLKSYFWKSIAKDDIDRKNARKFPKVFTDLMYKNKGKTPKQWTSTTVFSVLTEDFPNEVDLSDEAGFDVVPVLGSYIEYLGSIHYIKNASTLVETILRSNEVVLESCTNPEIFELAKEIFSQAMDSDLNFENQEDLENFIQEFMGNEYALPSMEELKSLTNQELDEMVLEVTRDFEYTKTLKDLLEEEQTRRVNNKIVQFKFNPKKK